MQPIGPIGQVQPENANLIRLRIRTAGIGIALTAGLMPHLPVLKILSDAEDEQLNLSLSSMRDRKQGRPDSDIRISENKRKKIKGKLLQHGK
jgi:hypothetical protein